MSFRSRRFEQRRLAVNGGCAAPCGGHICNYDGAAALERRGGAVARWSDGYDAKGRVAGFYRRADAQRLRRRCAVDKGAVRRAQIADHDPTFVDDAAPFVDDAAVAPGHGRIVRELCVVAGTADGGRAAVPDGQRVARAFGLELDGGEALGVGFVDQCDDLPSGREERAADLVADWRGRAGY